MDLKKFSGCKFMEIEEDIKQILKYAVMAPSGENCQPWSFKVSEKTINLFNLPQRDQSLYNVGQCGSYVSHGALIENVKISALELGYSVTVKIFPNSNDKNHVATIVLEKGSHENSPLYGAIDKRITNRKPFIKKVLPEEEVRKLKESVSVDKVKILFTQKNSDKQILAKAASMNESVMMSNRFLHDFFFSHVTWTKEEDNQKKIGFFIDTLELPLPAQKIFKMVKNWNIANFLNKLGLHKMVGKQNAKTYASSSGFGVLTTRDISPEGFINAGVALEQVWLTATTLGINFQPVSGLLFLMNAFRFGETDKFTNHQKINLEEGYEKIRQTFLVNKDEHIVFMFRFGHGDKPTARSSRFKIEDFINQN
jgi:nitroreductase